MNTTIYTFENISQFKFNATQQLRDAVFECGKKAGFSMYTRSSKEANSRITFSNKHFNFQLYVVVFDNHIMKPTYNIFFRDKIKFRKRQSFDNKPPIIFELALFIFR